MKLFHNLYAPRPIYSPASNPISRRGGALLLFWMLGLTLTTLSLAGAGSASPATTTASALAVASVDAFGPLDSLGNSADGAYPVASLTVGAYGTLYGVTAGGGTHGAGTIFKVRPDGSGYTVLRSLDSDTDGAAPMGTLAFYGGDTLYGTTSDRGPGGGGTVFLIKTDGSGFTVLHAFPAADYAGGYPAAGLTPGGDGFYYGTTSGGASGAGVVFRIAPDGSGYGVLHVFMPSGSGLDVVGGDMPLAPVLVRGGVLYGTTYQGGDHQAGSVFRICTGGSGYAVLYSFTGGADGGFPQAALTAGGDGFLYGTTSDSQLLSNGSVFKITPGGTGFATLYSFSGGTDGGSPYAPVSVGHDGKLYGTTFGGGTNGAGTVFAINADGTGLTTVASLSGSGSDGGYPSAGLTMGTQGQWYGAAYEGGPDGTGALFTLVAPPSGTIHLTSAPSGGAHAHVLWNNADGSASIWDLSDPNPAATAHAYGPFPGWTAATIADGPGNIVSLLWKSADGAMCVWRVDGTGAHTTSPVYGPSTTWSPKALSVGPDGQTRVLWDHVSGICQVWTLDAQGAIAGATPGYTPSAGWTATGLAVGGDGLTHLLWNHVSGACQVWTLDPAGPHTDTPVYGPSNTWTARAIAAGPDGLTRMMWTHTSGICQVWTINTQGRITTATPGYTAPAGSTAGGITVGADGMTRLLWNHSGVSCQLWTLDPAGPHTDSPVYSLSAGWNVAALTN